MKVFGKGTSAVSAAMDHTLRIWNLVSGTEKFSIEDTHFSKPHLCQLHVDERNMVVYSASGEKVQNSYPFHKVKCTERITAYYGSE